MIDSCDEIAKAIRSSPRNRNSVVDVELFFAPTLLASIAIAFQRNSPDDMPLYWWQAHSIESAKGLLPFLDIVGRDSKKRRNCVFHGAPLMPVNACYVPDPPRAWGPV